MKTHGDEGWNSPTCTKARCKKVLRYGEAVQFLDEDGQEQRYCDPHWVERNREPEPAKEGS